MRIAWWLPLLASAACGASTRTPEMRYPGRPPAAIAGLDTVRVHMLAGDVYLLGMWQVDSAGLAITGSGRHFGLRRDPLGTGDFRIPADSVALIETSRSEYATSFGAVGLGVLTFIGTYLSAVCTLDPKACFGSCPTFYVEGADSTRVVAEGFSGSIARALEARDVDAIPHGVARGRTVMLTMRNEAMETHLVRRVALLAVRRPADGDVVAIGDSVFRAARSIGPARSCTSATGDCTAQLAWVDGVERSSPADATDLATREVIELAFDAPPGELGLAITARQSLMTTYLFYQTIAFLGRGAGDVLAALERGGPDVARRAMGMADVLGAIEVEVHDGLAWRAAGGFGEPGPIAQDRKAVPLGQHAGGPLRVRLRLTKGHWRIDQVRLVALGAALPAERLVPATAYAGEREVPDVAARLRGGSLRVVTRPGDDYRLRFDLPDDAAALELFVESEGFYYEWLRHEWLADENPVLGALALADPHAALRALAPGFKQREAQMDSVFWNSRFNPRRDDATPR